MQVCEKLKLKKLHILLGTVHITNFILKMEYTLTAAYKTALTEQQLKVTYMNDHLGHVL
jgi:hypothetical protein